MKIKFNSGVGSIIQLAVLFKFAVDPGWSLQFVDSKYLREADGVYELVDVDSGVPNYKQVSTIILVKQADFAIKAYLKKGEYKAGVPKTNLLKKFILKLRFKLGRISTTEMLSLFGPDPNTPWMPSSEPKYPLWAAVKSSKDKIRSKS